MRGENRSTRGKTSHSRVENQQTQSTYVAECGNRTRAICECHKAVRNNQDAILCVTCGTWSHAKCLNMSQTTFQYYLDQPDIEWTCPACALPQLTDSFFEEVPEGDTLILAEDHQRETTQNTAPKQCLHRDVTETIFNNDRLELFRKHHNKDFLIAHLNINSIQNEFEELTEVINKINAHIMFVSETKIDASYPNAQFKVPNYFFYEMTGRRAVVELWL